MRERDRVWLRVMAIIWAGGRVLSAQLDRGEPLDVVGWIETARRHNAGNAQVTCTASARHTESPQSAFGSLSSSLPSTPHAVHQPVPLRSYSRREGARMADQAAL